MKATGYEAITVSDTAIGFTTAKIAMAAGEKCKEAFCVLEDNDVRFTLDGTTPTSSTGTLLLAGENLTLDNEEDIINFRVIRVSSNASLKCIYKF